MSYRLIQGELSFKFSAAHFVLASAGCERLHGHNYLVEVQIYGEQNPELDLVIDFLELKPFVRDIIEVLDHKVILPLNNSGLVIETKDGELFVTFKPKKKDYIFPKEDTVLLPLNNTTVEEFARYFCEKLRPLFEHHSNISQIEVGVFEYKGQGCWKKITR